MDLVDTLEKTMDAGRSVPLARGRLIDTDRIYEIVDEIRGSVPEELKQARWVVKERQEMLEEAEKEANNILEGARDRVEARAADQETVRAANQEAAALLDDARQAEHEIRLGAEDYAEEMLGSLESNLGKMLNSVQSGRDRLQGKTGQDS
jgi:cell division septum initiation protein DivIVA